MTAMPHLLLVLPSPSVHPSVRFCVTAAVLSSVCLCVVVVLALAGPC